MPTITPVPNTPLRDDPSQDAIWKRWLGDVRTQTNEVSVSTIPATAGGTGITSYAVGDLLYANTTTSLAKLAIGEVYGLLRVNSSGGGLEYTAFPTTRNSILSGETLTVVSSRVYMSASPLNNIGTLANNGTVLIL